MNLTIIIIGLTVGLKNHKNLSIERFPYFHPYHYKIKKDNKNNLTLVKQIFLNGK